MVTDFFDELMDLEEIGKGIQGTERTLKKWSGSWWRDPHIYQANSVLLRSKCERVVS